MNPNPVLAELTRGGIVESFHRGAYAIVNASGELIDAAGDIERPIFPRSAIKVLQALPCVHYGAADQYGFNAAELSIACSSHNGEPVHIATVQSMLDKSEIEEASFECGVFWPSLIPASRDLVAAGQTPSNLHNECSGKHAAMMATARHMNEDIEGYSDPSHPVQIRIREIISDLCQHDLESAACGIDGCSVPTWAMPLKNVAAGFARFSAHEDGKLHYYNSAGRLIKSVREEPYMVAGRNAFSTQIMEAVPRIFAKTGAEGVMCGLVEHAGLGIAVKIDDGSARAAEVIFAKIAARLGVWDDDEQRLLEQFANKPLLNRRKIETGTIRAA